MTAWMHSRRGRIEGDVVSESGEWVTIRLTVDSSRASTRARGHGPVDPAGDTITVRRTHLQELGS